MQHVISDVEWGLVRTDRAMLDEQPASALDRQAAEDLRDPDDLRREAIA